MTLVGLGLPAEGERKQGQAVVVEMRHPSSFLSGLTWYHLCDRLLTLTLSTQNVHHLFLLCQDVCRLAGALPEMSEMSMSVGNNLFCRIS